MEKLLTVEEAAGILERTPGRVHQLISEGELSAERFRRGARDYIRLREPVVMEYKRSRQIPAALPSE